MGVVVHVEIVLGPAVTLQDAVNERLGQVPRFELPLGIFAYPTHVNPEPNGTDWACVISYEVDEPDDEDEAVVEQVDEPDEPQTGTYVAVGQPTVLSVGMASAPTFAGSGSRIDWDS